DGRGGRTCIARSSPWFELSGWPLFALARRPAVPDDRLALWTDAGPCRGFRISPRDLIASRRAKCSNCQPRRSPASIFQSVLFLPRRPYRGGDDQLSASHENDQIGRQRRAVI